MKSASNTTSMIPANQITDGNIYIDSIQNTDEMTNEEGNVSTDLIHITNKTQCVDDNVSIDVIQPLDDASVEVVKCIELTPIRQRNWSPKEIITLLDYYHGLPGDMKKGTAVRWAIAKFN